jgi:2-dehydro-3-deoxyphosphogluconate aldolase / (4S)-4-hydroxy-2-oxoglutarate aldolase
MTLPPSLTPIADAGVIAVLRAPSADAAVGAVDALVAGGVTAIEVTYSTPDVPRVLATVAERYGDTVILGAGTVRRGEQAREAVGAGATFLVSPGIDDEIAGEMAATGATVMLGAVTPTEVMRAVKLGAHAVKIFPGSLVGPAYLKALRGPFPDVALMPTGGVSAANVGEWLTAGAFAVGAGGELASGADIGAGRWEAVRESAERFVTAVRAARSDAVAA